MTLKKNIVSSFKLFSYSFLVFGYARTFIVWAFLLSLSINVRLIF